MDLLLTGRWFDVEEAKTLGIIREIVKFGDLRRAAWDLARLLESGPPLVYAAIKEIVREAEDAKFQDVLNRITKRQFSTVDKLYSSDDQIEGAKAFAEKKNVNTNITIMFFIFFYIQQILFDDCYLNLK